MFNLVLENL
jgi:hypothetical protein